MKEPLISILVPVYNAEAYLAGLIEQVCQQTLTNWEMIMINDGSTDQSGQLCGQLASHDERMKVIHQSNQGVSNTRNNLLEQARGTYLVFIDADDRFNQRFLEKMVQQIQEFESDIGVCGFREIKEVSEKIIQSEEKIFYLKDLVKVNELQDCIMTFINSGTFNPLWNKIYKREIIQQYQIRFPKHLTTGEDFIFNLNYFKHVEKISFSNETLYDYLRRQNNSITYQYIDQMYEKGIEIHEKLEQFLKQMNYDTQQNKLILMENHLGGIFSTCLNLYHPNCHLTYRQKRQQIKDILKRDYVKCCAREVNTSNKIIKMMQILIKLNSTLTIMGCFYLISLVRRGKK